MAHQLSLLDRARKRATTAKADARKAEREAAAAARKLETARKREAEAVAHHERVKVTSHTRRWPKKRKP